MERLKQLRAWLEHRTGCEKLLHEALYENVPGGSRWRYVWGSTLTFTFLIQIITGIFLWMAYSANANGAWESVYFIQHEMWGGWLLRGIHHYTAQAMNILLVLHLMQVIIDGAYKAPREINYWFGMILLLLVLGLSLTGYLLPWDQKGYWATKVATNIMAITPVVGAEMQKAVIGGSDYGHHTLTRFFALHAGVLPGLMMVMITAHVYLFRRHGLTAKEPKMKPDCAFWPDQVLKDAVACLAVMGAVLILILLPRLTGSGEPGAELGAPADPSEAYSAARPEWYFLFLFQFLKYFPGRTEIWGALIIPGVIMGVLFAMPLLGKSKRGHRFNLAFLTALFAGIALLTFLAKKEDAALPSYQAAVKSSNRDAERAKELAHGLGIPASGAASLLHEDALTQGPKIFAKNCASCHRFDGHDGLGQRRVMDYIVQTNDTVDSIVTVFRMTREEFIALNPTALAPPPPGRKIIVHEPPTASDLKGFGSRAWLAGLLDPEKISGPHYFGGSKMADGKMARFVKKDVAKYTPEQQAQLQKVIAALSAEAKLKAQHDADQRDETLIVQGRELLKGASACTECHAFQKPDPDATGPDLTGWASREWLTGFITNPAHEKFYGKKNDRMPKFGDQKILDAQAIGLVADWLRGEWFEPKSAAR